MTVGQWPKDDKQTIYSTFIVLKIESLALLEIIRGLTCKPANLKDIVERHGIKPVCQKQWVTTRKRKKWICNSLYLAK